MKIYSKKTVYLIANKTRQTTIKLMFEKIAYSKKNKKKNLIIQIIDKKNNILSHRVRILNILSSLYI
jgi:hypothetical protein